MPARSIAMTATRAPLAGLATLGANTFTGAQTITNGTAAGASSFAFPTSAAGATDELILQATRANYNVFGVQNLDRVGYSALIARASSPLGVGREKTAIGVGNDQATSLQNSVYWEGWSGYSFPSNDTTSSASTVAGTVLTVGGTVAGSFSPGQLIYGAGVTTGTKIISYGTGTGGTGTYNLDTSMTVASPVRIGALGYPPEMRIVSTGWNDLLSGGTSTSSTIAGTVLTVGGSVTGTWAVGQLLSGSGVTANTRIISLGTGVGGAGTYNLSVSQTIAVGQVINGLGVDTREDRILFTPEGYVKIGRWGTHGAYSALFNPDGTTTFNGTVTVPAISVSGSGTVSGVGDFSMTGNMNWGAGTIPNWASSSAFRNMADGSIRLSNNANTGFTSLLFATGATPQASGIYVVTGSPEGATTARIGSIALRLDGGAVTSFYVKESGTGNTGWVAK